MKKHYCIQSFREKSVLMRCMKKIPLAMRCTLFMLFCLVGMTFANEGYAQKTMVNIALENKTVDEVLTELEQGTEFVTTTSRLTLSAVYRSGQITKPYSRF